MVAITIDKLVKKFGDQVALDGISLRIEPGEIFFLLGPSGCGKTTLLRSIAGFSPPDSGRILFGDRDVSQLPPHERHTGMMFQSYALWPHLTVAQNVAFGLEEQRRPSAEIREKVAEALASVRMEKLGERKIQQLSGGQQQRVALARALVVRPQALLLDEPLSNLDARLRLEMRTEIRRICKEAGLTAIYVTHDQKEALSISDRMAILTGGRIAQVGTPEEIYRTPQSREVAEFIGETNFLEGRIAEASGSHWKVETPIGLLTGRITLPGWEPAKGDPATVSIRPESWKLAGSGPNAVAGRIVDSTYLGEMAQHEFEAGGVLLKFFELDPKTSKRTESTTLSVQPDNVIVLPG